MIVAKVFRYELNDLLRSRWVMGYILLLVMLTEALLRFGGGGPRAVMSLMNVVLIFVPLVSVVFGAMYLYGAREFIEILLAQPVGRSHLFVGLYAGLGLPLAAAFAIGVGLPFLWHGGLGQGLGGPLLMLLTCGVLLTLAFTALAFVLSLKFEDRAKGLGAAILLWLASVALYDACLVLVTTAFSNYPFEKPLIALTLLNPVDLARVMLLLQLDIAALMGYTGAVFERFFGSLLGVAISAGALVLWCAGPLVAAHHRFCRRDF